MLLTLPANPDLKKILVLNPKGGSGKTTLAVNLAGYLANTGRSVALMDCDPQQSSISWLGNRPNTLPEIHGISAHKRNHSVTRSFQFRIPQGTEYLIVDSPAAVPDHQLIEYTHGAHAILVPVVPSAIDIAAASKLIEALLLRARVSRRMRRLGVVVNRAKQDTTAYRSLMSFLESLSISVVSILQDSQNYVRAAELGMCIHEMPFGEARCDLSRWLDLTAWLETRLGTPLTSRDFFRPQVRTDFALGRQHHRMM